MPNFVHFKCQGGGEQPLKVYLSRITETKIVEIPQELLTPIIDASHDAIGRRDVMRHLRECLSEPTGKRWHRIYAGLLLVERLMERGSHALTVELAHGHHFDLIQKVSLLEHFDSAARGVSNPWAQSMIRKKAGELRTSLVPLLQKASEEQLPSDSLLVVRDPISCSPALSHSTLSTAASSMSAGSPAMTSKMKRRKDVGSNVVESPEAFAAYPPHERLQRELNRITESCMVDLPPEFFTYVVRASNEPESQRTIVEHVRGCLREPFRTRWQRIHGCLCLVEFLLDRGAPQLFMRTGQSGGFNLVRQIWHLQEFEYRPDWRAQNLIRKKARLCYDGLVSREAGAQVADVGEAPHHAEGNIGDAFAMLRDWVEAVDLGEGAQSDDDSSRPSSNSSNLSDDEPIGDLPLGARRSVSVDSTYSAEEAHDHGHSQETFFTPMQTPALARAVARPSHLLSL
mmetsp:Transcript_32029/g.91324  ORF Transcript_32029/g.91324 Transcript_32029/m.91324 type:complete len:456 (+) Transcript_32029:72-1439(+)